MYVTYILISYNLPPSLAIPYARASKVLVCLLYIHGSKTQFELLTLALDIDFSFCIFCFWDSRDLQTKTSLNQQLLPPFSTRIQLHVQNHFHAPNLFFLNLEGDLISILSSSARTEPHRLAQPYQLTELELTLQHPVVLDPLEKRDTFESVRSQHGDRECREQWKVTRRF